MPDKKTLYIFIDESGNFDFSPSGTKFFVLTSVTTTRPLNERLSLLNLKYDLLKKGFNQECFHATEDKQEVRDLVYQEVGKLDDIEVDAIVAQKNKANPSLYIDYDHAKRMRGVFKMVRSEEKFYHRISQTLLQYIFQRHDNDEIEKIIVVLGALFPNNKHGYVLKSLKQYLKTKFKKPFYVYFHKTEADINCQLADYCGWAVYVNAERAEGRPLATLKGRLKSVFSIFDRGTTEYYQYKK